MRDLMSPEYQFPIDITAYVTGGGVSNSPYKFGLKIKGAIEALRCLADRLEAKDCILQGVESSQSAGIHDYTISKFCVSYVRKKEIKPESLSSNAG